MTCRGGPRPGIAAVPATLAQNHPDALLYVNANAARTAY